MTQPVVDPEWVRRLGAKVFRAAEPSSKPIIDVRIENPMVSDAEITAIIPALEGLPLLRRLSLNSANIGDTTLRELARVSQLTALNLIRTKITDKGLAHLQALSRLERLSLNGNRITGDGLRHLASLEHLTLLAMDGTELDDEHLTHVARLRHLTTLSITSTRVTGAGLAALAEAELQRLYVPKQAKTNDGLKYFLRAVEPQHQLSLQGWSIDDTGAALLATQRQLKSLNLSGTAITDVGIGHLASLENLHFLNVNNTQLTGAGFGQLRNLNRLLAANTQIGDEAWEELVHPSLIILNVVGSKLTPAAVERLRQEMPECRVFAAR